MENIFFSIEEDAPQHEFNIDDLNTFSDSVQLNNTIYDTINYDTIYDSIDIAELENYYKSNYNVRGLHQILNYYGIPKKNMVKDEVLQCILFFEMEPANKEVVLKRMRLWRNIRELKADNYFAKYINFNI